MCKKSRTQIIFQQFLNNGQVYHARSTKLKGVESIFPRFVERKVSFCPNDMGRIQMMMTIIEYDRLLVAITEINTQIVIQFFLENIFNTRGRTVFTYSKR